MGVEDTDYFGSTSAQVCILLYCAYHGICTSAHIPCEDGHAQERSLLGAVLETVQAGDLWIQDRTFCTRAFLGAIDTRGACFITRQQEGLPYEILRALRSVGRIETGQVAEQRGRVWDAQGTAPVLRRLRVKLAQPTRDGDRLLYLVTNVPPRKASAKRIARL